MDSLVNYQKYVGDKYKIIHCFKRGILRKVFLVKRRVNGIKYVAKFIFLNETSRDIAMREGNCLTKLEHPNIVKLVECIEHTSCVIYILNYIEGGMDLCDYLSTKEEVSLPIIKDIFIKVYKAVSYMHKMGFAHCDLKPENIYITKTTDVQLLDFGSILPVETKDIRKNINGTGFYMPPEFFQGGKIAVSLLDVFSLGKILNEMATGLVPDLNVVPRISNRSKDLESLLIRMLDVNPHTRIKMKKIASKKFFKMQKKTNIQNYW